MENNNKKGRWVTINGTHVLIKNGQSVNEAMQETFKGKRGKKRVNQGKFEYSADGGNTWEDMDEQSYNELDADEDAFDENVEDDFGFDEDEKQITEQSYNKALDYFNFSESQPSFEQMKKRFPDLDDNAIKSVMNDVNWKDYVESDRNDEPTSPMDEFSGPDQEGPSYAQLEAGKKDFKREKPDDPEKEPHLIGPDGNRYDTEEDYNQSQKEEKKPFDIEKHNRMVGLESQMHSLVDNARKNGQSPQQVLDSVAYDMNIEPGTEEFNRLKNIVMYDTRMNKDTGKYEYNRFNVGSNKLLSKPEDREKINDLKMALQDAGLQDAKIEDGYEDYGANMQWTNITSGDTWVLDPKDWMDYMNDNATKEEIVDRIKNGKYKDVFKWKNERTPKESLAKQLRRVMEDNGYSGGFSDESDEDYLDRFLAQDNRRTGNYSNVSFKTFKDRADFYDPATNQNSPKEKLQNIYDFLTKNDEGLTKELNEIRDRKAAEYSKRKKQASVDYWSKYFDNVDENMVDEAENIFKNRKFNSVSERNTAEREIYQALSLLKKYKGK